MSRPKKEILLVCPNIVELDARACVFETHPYRVHTATNVLGAHLALKTRPDVRAVVALFMPEFPAQKIPVIAVVNPSQVEAVKTKGAIAVVAGAEDMRTVLEFLKSHTALKRGPKPAGKQLESVLDLAIWRKGSK